MLSTTTFRKIMLSFCAVIGFSIQAQQALPELLYYRFDQPGTSVPNDATSPVGNNPATITGTTLSIGGVGLSGTALVGTGGTSTANAINTNWNTNLSGSFTIGFWTSSIPASSTLFYIFGDAGANTLRCFTNGVAGAGNWIMRGGGLPDITATGAATMTANYVHFVYDAVAGTLTSYVDGVLSNTTTVTGFTGMTGTGFQIGAYNTTTGHNGLLDEFRIYNRALTVAEIQSTINGTIVTGPCTSAIAGTASPASQTICVGNSASISAVGASFGTGASYQWQSSTNGTTWINMPNDTLPAITVSPTDTTFYRMIMTCGVASSISSVAVVNTQGTPLNGTYTINQSGVTAGTNFASFQDFFDAMECGGVSGPVVANVVSGTGPYLERVEAGPITGTSATNTITINGNGNTLSYAATGTNDRTTFVLDGTTWLHVDSLNIFATGTTYGWVLQLMNGADHNSFTNCHFETSTSSTSTFFSNVVMSGSLTSATLAGNSGSFNTFENNTHVGGYYGFTMNGPSSASRNVGNKIINSTFEDFYLYGLYIRSQEDVEIIGNDLSRATRTTVSTLYALYFATGISGAIVKNNRLHDFYNANTANTTGSYPLYMTGATGTAAKPNLFANNLIYNLEHSGIQYSLYLLGALNDYWKIYHNTVVIDQPNFTGSNATRNVFISGSQNNMEIKNNIFYTNRGSAPQFYVYMTNAATNVDFDNNVYYSPNASNVTFGFLGANINTFADWQAAGFDANGVEFDPTFVGVGTDFYRPTVGAIKSLGTNVLSDVPEDIEGTPRTTSPDPGVYQFTPSPCTGAFDLTADSLFPGGAILSWESFGAVNEWQIEWDTCGFVPGSGLGNLDSVVTNNTNYNLSMPMGQCFCVFVREKCPTGGYGVWTGPLQICVPIEYDAELLSLVNPEDLSCGDSLMPITVEIRNNGFFPITSMPITANISGDITQTLSMTYTGNLLENEVDTVVVGTVNMYNGGYINVETYTSLANDQFNGNDTLRKDSLLVIPFQPLVTSAEYCPGETDVTIRALPMSSARYEWFNTATGGTPIGTGDSIVVPVSSGTLYVGYMDNQDSLNTIQQGGSGCGAGNMFDIIPNSTLDITGFTVRPFSTEANMPISVWIVTGGYQGTTQANWTLVESGVIPNAVINTPVRFNLTNPLTVNASTTYGIYLQFNASYTVGANTYSNSDMTLIAGLGLCQPFDYCCDPRTWNGAIHYGTSACSDIRTPVTPTALDSVQANFDWTTISHTVSFQSTSANADSVVWDFAGLGTASGDSVSFQFPQTDSFEVCMIAYNACGTDTICQMVWAENISVERFGELLNLRLFPNPNNGSFTVSFLQHLKGDLQVEIIDLSGRVILNQLYTNHQGAFDNTYDLSHLASGMYQMRLRSPDGTAIRSFVISK
jgi:hypothetical protein